MDNLTLAPATGCLTKAGLAAGTTTTLTQTLAGGATANIIAIRGKMYSVAPLSNTASPTADWGTGKGFLPVLANQGSVFLIGFSSSGGLRVTQGQVAPLDANGNFVTAPLFGATGPVGSGVGAGGAVDFCPVSYLVIKAGATADNNVGWIFGISNMSGVTGITYAFQDVCGITDRPQIS